MGGYSCLFIFFRLQKKLRRMYAVASSYRPVWGPTVSTSSSLSLFLSQIEQTSYYIILYSNTCPLCIACPLHKKIVLCNCP